MVKLPVKVLFGGESPFWTPLFINTARALSDIQCKLLGFSAFPGPAIRKAGLQYSHVPWRTDINPAQTLPPFQQIQQRYSEDKVPTTIRRAYAACSCFVQDEIRTFAPDVVVCGVIDECLARLIDEAAARRSIPRICLQTSFVSNYFICHHYGNRWIEHFSTAKIPDGNKEPDSARPSSIEFRKNCDAYHAGKMYRCLSFLERVTKVLSGCVSFDTAPYLASRCALKFVTRTWFPKSPTLRSADEIGAPYILVAMNQPVLGYWGEPSWHDLIRFAIQSAPGRYAIVLRPHPREPACELPNDIEEMCRAREIRISRPGVGPTLNELIRRTRAVMTMNSAVGMEALLAGKPVFTMAPAFYARPGMARAVSLDDAPSAREMLENENELGPDVDEVRRFAKWLISSHMVPYPLTQSGEAGTLAARIRSICQLS